ncbi:MAG: hypothetical protein RID42_15555 [Alphaproteobacteria bacterium]
MLLEVPETDAPTDIAHLYGEIRIRMGVPFVALFYRNLAGIDGALAWMWDIVAPLLASGRLQRTAARVAAAGAPPARLSLGAAPDDRAAIGAVVAAYNRANPMNYTCAALLDHILSARSLDPDALEGSVFGDERLPEAPKHVPPMVSPDAFPAELRVAVGRLESSETAGDGIVPSLYRHLANWPGFLGAAATALGRRFDDGSILTAAHAVAEAGRHEVPRLVAGLNIAPAPPLLITNRAAVTESVEKFSRRIPEMIVVGRLLAAALMEEKNV